MSFLIVDLKKMSVIKVAWGYLITVEYIFKLIICSYVVISLAA